MINKECKVFLNGVEIGTAISCQLYIDATNGTAISSVKAVVQQMNEAIEECSSVKLKIKTPHRMMREVLTDEEWARFLKNQNYLKVSSFYQGNYAPSRILTCAFVWCCTAEGVKYWENIYYRLLCNENTN